MIERPLEPTLIQMLDAIRYMRRFTANMTFASYQADAKTKLAVERCIEIIAEAARRLPQSVQATQPSIPWDDIKGIGNVLRHGYDSVEDKIIWSVVERHLAPLEAALISIARATGADLSKD